MEDQDLEPSGFRRDSPVRSTVARKCREFYLQRLERTTNMQKRWSICEGASTDDIVRLDISDTNTVQSSQDSSSEICVNSTLPSSAESTSSENRTNVVNEDSEVHPLRKCHSSLDLAMTNLRKEISSLIEQDNDLFRQLLSLHDSIAELRERQRSCYNLYPDDEDDEDVLCKEEDGEDGDREDDSQSPSLESLSDNGDMPETSPESTLSCRSSSLSSDSVKYHHKSRQLHYGLSRNRHRIEAVKKRHRAMSATSTDEPRPLVFVDKSQVCFRCRKMAPPFRNSRYGSYWLNNQEELESYDSGIHLQGSHSDSDHEIFV